MSREGNLGGPEPVRRLPGPSRGEVLDGLAGELTAAGAASGRAEAERLVAYALGVSRSDLLLHADRPVGPDEAGRIASLARRRLLGVPLQHLEGTVAFRELVLTCDGRALVPRPETEQLVQLVVDWCSGGRSRAGVRRVIRSRPTGGPPLERVLDIGVGSGAIALSLLQEGVAQRAVGVDVSPAALELAGENAARAGLADRLELRRVTVSPWEAVGADESFDGIVSNPPYVADPDIPDLQVEVREHDPRVALAGGHDGLDVIREIAARAAGHLRAHGALFLEVGAGQGPVVRDLLASTSSWRSVDVAIDLAGRARFVTALL